MEFRGHDATVDPEEVKVWVKFLLMAMDFAGQTAPAEMERICKDELKTQKIQSTYMTLPEICELIGFPEGARNGAIWEVIPTNQTAGLGEVLYRLGILGLFVEISTCEVA